MDYSTQDFDHFNASQNLFFMFDVVLTSHLDFQDSKDQDFGKKIISLKIVLFCGDEYFVIKY